MRRCLGFLAVLGLLLASTSVPAAAVTVTRMELTSARLLAQGVAVELTFRISCRDFASGDRIIINGQLEQRVRGVKVISPTFDAGAETCEKPIVARVGVASGRQSWKAGKARVTATAFVCMFSGCPERKLATVIQLQAARPVPPKPTSVGDFQLGFKLISSRLVAKGEAVDLRFEVTCRSEGFDSCTYYYLIAGVAQNVRGFVTSGQAFKSYQASTRHRVTIRASKGEGHSRFRSGQALISANIEACFGLGCPGARVSGVVRLSGCVSLSSLPDLGAVRGNVAFGSWVAARRCAGLDPDPSRLTR